MTPTLRRFTIDDDLDALTKLLHAAYAPLARMDLHFTATHQSIETTESRVATGECYVAELNERLVATITWYRPIPNDTVPYYRRMGVAHFGQFGVHPEFLGQGIGKLLHNHILQEATKTNHTEMALDTSDQALHLIEMYKNWGYKIVDTHDWRPGVNYASVVMARDIS